ncbi:MAG: FKBP-type peptidyl-prolyl cis-trans isomerase [Maricaulaceae bacterium]
MKHILITSLLSASFLLTACDEEDIQAAVDNGTPIAADMGEAPAAMDPALANCPADQTLTDISAYSFDVFQADSAEMFHGELAKREDVVTLPSGLQYTVVKSGNPEGPKPLPTDTVTVHYHGLFPTGQTFDSSYDRGETIDFPLNRVIKGWTDGVGLMRPCDAWTFYIPSDLAYGPKGRPGIPGGASLVFHVQLLGVQ